MRTVVIAAPRKVGKPTTALPKAVRQKTEEYAKQITKALKLPKPTIRWNAKTSTRGTYHALEYGRGLTELRIFIDPIKGKMSGQAVSKKWKSVFPTTALKNIEDFI